ncbi:V-type ATP synthase subunit E [Cucumispora dikerogammari]|nr:V-type ATP synthase subunit E [Cucumispora dikerogammari]
MDQFNNKTEQLIQFVKHETEQQVAEIRLKTIEEYQLEKSKLIKLKASELLNSFNTEKKKILTEKLIKISELKSEYRLKLSDVKSRIVERIFKEVKLGLERKFKLTNLIKEVKENLGDECKLFVNKKDVKQGLLPVPNPILGGCIGVSLDGLSVCDNSYDTRIETIKRNHLNEINKILFN